MMQLVLLPRFRRRNLNVTEVSAWVDVYVSYSVNPFLKRVIWGLCRDLVIGLIKEDIRSFDYSSCEGRCSKVAAVALED